MVHTDKSHPPSNLCSVRLVSTNWELKSSLSMGVKNPRPVSAPGFSPFWVSIYHVPTVSQVPFAGAGKHNEWDIHIATVSFCTSDGNLRECICQARVLLWPSMLGNGHCRVALGPLKPLGLQRIWGYPSIPAKDTLGSGRGAGPGVQRGSSKAQTTVLLPQEPTQAGSWAGVAKVTQFPI